MATVYSYKSADAIIARYIDRGGDVYTVPGCLVDSHIVTAPGFKSYIIRECPISAYSSGVTIRRYNKIPAKYQAVIDAFENGDDERAARLFWKR